MQHRHLISQANWSRQGGTIEIVPFRWKESVSYSLQERQVMFMPRAEVALQE